MEGSLNLKENSMACRKNLLTIDYHYDDETGMYRVGEIDTGVNCVLPEYIEQYREGST